MTATKILLDKVIETAKWAKETSTPNDTAFCIKKIKALADTLSAINSYRVEGISIIEPQEEFI